MAKNGAAAATALTPVDYHSAETFARERRTLFVRAWIPVCRAAEVESGSQRAALVGAQPVLVTRDEAGALHALSNVCRHRGMTIVDGETRAGVIRCPYHLWTYDLDGGFRAAPFMDGADLSACDLPRYQAQEWGGWVFVNLAADAPSLEAQLAPLAETLDPGRLAGLEVGYRLEFEHAWNWKVMLENFGESYHHIGTHLETLQPLWPGGQTDSTDGGEGALRIRHPHHPEVGTLDVYVGFPLFMLATTPQIGGAVWYRMTPTGPEHIALEIVGLYPPEAAADADQMRESQARLFAIHQEDMVVCERVQAGLRAPDAILGPLSPLEAGVGRFRTWVARELGRA